MSIQLSGETQTGLAIENMTPRQIVGELDKYVVGQRQAKRAVAIALRNRWRRQQLPPELAEEIAPKNILMIGSTGVGKTEIARRLARLARAPFLKVEASIARAEDRLLQLLVPPRPISSYLRKEEQEEEDDLQATREKFRSKLRAG